MRKVLYTLDAYDKELEKESWFNRVSARRNQAYCEARGADYHHVVINPVVHKPAHYHKLDIFKIFLQSDYDRAVFLDMDIYIENECPDLWLTQPTGAAMIFDYLMPLFTNYEPWCESTFGEGVKPQVTYTGPTVWGPATNEHNAPEFKNRQPWRYFNTGVMVFDKQFAKFLVDNVQKVKYSDDPNPKWPDGWGEQHYFNYALDKARYPVNELSREFNELTGLTRSRGKFCSHYAAPWGRSMLSQREIHGDQASFQRKYLKGKILNVGCNEDYARLKQDFGAYNIDVWDTDPTTGIRNAHDELADARDLPEKFNESFDTVVLGEILEHFNTEDRQKTLHSAKRAIKENGWINMTFPYDTRELQDQRRGHSLDIEYTEGVSAFHEVPLSKEMVLEDLEACGLKAARIEEIHYPFDNVKGTGILACKPEWWQRQVDNMELIFDTE